MLPLSPEGATLPKLRFTIARRELSLPHSTEGVPPSSGLIELSFERRSAGAFILSDAPQDSEIDGKDYGIVLTRRKPRELPR